MGNKKGSWIVLGLGIFLAVRLGLNLTKLYKAGGRLSEQEMKLSEVKRENEELKEKLAEVQTSEYMEREAREKLGMGKEGEVVVVVPETENQQVDNGLQTEGETEPNWRQWRKLYLRF